MRVPRALQLSPFLNSTIMCARNEVEMIRAAVKSQIVLTAIVVTLLWSLTSTAVLSSALAQEPDRPSPKVALARTAQVRVSFGSAGVLIEWRLLFGLDNLGFNIYREDQGERTRVNPSLIAGSASLARQKDLPYSQFTHQWIDEQGRGDSRYYLEEVSLNGDANLLGPFEPVWSSTFPRYQQASLLGDVVAQADASSQTGGPSGTLDQPAPIPASIQDQWLIAAQPALKIGIKVNGWYRITQTEMVAAGFDVSGDAKNLRLFVDAREVPIEVSRSSGQLGANDYIEFYATAVDTPTTDTNVYYLVNGAQPGLRVPVFGEIHVDTLPGASPTPLVVTLPGEVPSSTQFIDLSLSCFGSLTCRASAGNDSKKADTDGATFSPPPPAAIPSQPSSMHASEMRFAQSRGTPRGSADEANPDRPSVAKTSTKPQSVVNQSSSLSSSERPGKRKSRRRMGRNHSGRASRIERKRDHVVDVGVAASGFLYDVQLKERFLYFSSLLNGSAENFFGGSLAVPPYPPNTPTTKTLTVTSLQASSQGTPLLRIGVQGTNQQAHAIDVFLNDVMVGSLSFNALDYLEQTFAISPSQLREGANTIKFVVTGGTGVLFSYARLTYPRVYRASNDTLSFSLRSTQSVTVDGFTTSSLRVLDISDPNAVQEVHSNIANGASGYSITVPAAGVKAKGVRTLLAQPLASFLHPASLSLNQASTLNQSSNGADLLIISHQSFLSLPNLATLVSQRQSQGLTVKTADIEDVFDEFSYGKHTSQAITGLLSQARSAWAKPPKYLLLIGDASYDPRNYEGAGNTDLVPTRLIDTGFPGTSTALETGSDDSLADFDGDGIPEIAVGRLPVRTVAEANLELSKILNFSPANVAQTTVMVADAQGTYYFNFEQANENLINLLPTGMQGSVQRIYRRLESSDAVAHTDIVNSFNQGAALVNYSGHGNVDVWTGAPIFSTSDAMALTNGNKLPLVIVMDCLNGYFIAPSLDSVGEAFLKAPNGGAVASFTSSGLTIPDGQHEMGQRLFQLLYSGPSIALGDATRQAKAATSDIDVRRSWILLGDPTMKIR
jgi:Peptidase family C25